MAGLGRKVFNSGDILLASEVQGFLQDQAVMVFDDDAARGSAIATPTEGMVTFRKDDNALEVFDGSTFVAVGGGAEPGLVHIESQTFSAVSAFSMENFTSATFKRYKFFYSGTGSTSSSLFFRFRENTTDKNANYTGSGVNVPGSGSLALTAQRVNGTAPNIIITNATNKTIAEYNLYKEDDGVGHIWGYQVDHAAQKNYGYINTGMTNWTGFSLVAASGTFTGAISLFGYEY